MAGMKMGKTGLMSMQGMQPQTFLQAIAHHATSGTSAEPNSTPTPMLMANKGPVDAHVPRQRLLNRPPAIKFARRRQVFLDELVHGNGAARAGTRSFHGACNVKP